MTHLLIQDSSNHYSRRQSVGGRWAVATDRHGSVLAPLVTGLIAVLATGALMSSGYLAWVGLTSSKVLGCDGGMFDCGHVLTSRWSAVLGIPVGLPAVLVYTLMLVAVAGTRSSNATVGVWALRTVWLLSMTAAFAAVWFVSLQVTYIGRLCPYCLLVHGCGIFLAALMIWKAPIARVMSLKLTAVAGLLVGIMIVTQLLTPAPETFVIEQRVAPAAVIDGGEIDVFEAPVDPDVEIGESGAGNALVPDGQTYLIHSSTNLFVSLASFDAGTLLLGVLMAPQEKPKAAAATTTKKERKLVPILGGSKSLDANQWPLWGNADADHIVVEMFDYTCSHCRNTHKAIREASVQLNGSFAVLALPVPLHRDCNDAATSSAPECAHACEIARIAIAVWLADRSKFTELHDWLFEQERSAADARAKAEQLIGAEALRQQLAKSTASSYLQKNVELYKAAGSGIVPKIIFPSQTIVGEVTSGSTIVKMVR